MRENQKIARMALGAVAAIMILGGSGAQAADMKVATVKMQVIINESVAGKNAVGALKVRMETEGKKLQEMKKKLVKLEGEYNQQKMIWRPDVVEEKEFEMIRLRRDLENNQKDSSNMLRRAQAKASQKIINDVQHIIDGYAKQKGIVMVLENSSGLNPTGGVVAYADDSIDITADIIKLYDAKASAKP
ncbi:MAG: OmpH family outer membrane protein [Nitrospinota bacterium]|nr:OmpH family outer membrane protein [Nitrospinota bacterium]